MALERMSRLEYKKSAEKKNNKYKNKWTVVDGIKFQSKREAEYYCELRLREKVGEVSAVELQRPFALLGAAGDLICTYVSDFCFWDHVEDRFRCIDVKGVETRDFRLKKKMMKSFLGITVEVVK